MTLLYRIDQFKILFSSWCQPQIGSLRRHRWRPYNLLLWLLTLLKLWFTGKVSWEINRVLSWWQLSQVWDVEYEIVFWPDTKVLWFWTTELELPAPGITTNKPFSKISRYHQHKEKSHVLNYFLTDWGQHHGATLNIYRTIKQVITTLLQESVPEHPISEKVASNQMSCWYSSP